MAYVEGHNFVTLHSFDLDRNRAPLIFDLVAELFDKQRVGELHISNKVSFTAQSLQSSGSTIGSPYSTPISRS